MPPSAGGSEPSPRSTGWEGPTIATHGAGYTYRPQVQAAKNRNWISALITFVVMLAGIGYGLWWVTGRPMAQLPDEIGQRTRFTDLESKNNSDEITRADQSNFAGATVQTGIYGVPPSQKTLIITTFEGSSVTSLTAFEQTLGASAEGGRMTTAGGVSLDCYAKGPTWITDTCFWEKDGIYGVAQVRASSLDDAEAQTRVAVEAVVTSWREKLIGR